MREDKIKKLGKQIIDLVSKSDLSVIEQGFLMETLNVSFQKAVAAYVSLQAGTIRKDENSN